MAIELTPELESRVRAQAESEGLSVQGFIENLLTEDSIAETSEDLVEIRSAVTEGLAEAESGNTKPAAQVFSEFRARHGLPR
jgi:hypothetical protein